MGLWKRAHVLEKAREWKNSQERKQWRGHFSENLVKSLKVITKLHLIWEAGHDGVLLSNEGEKSLKPQRESKSGTLSLSLSLSATHTGPVTHALFLTPLFSLFLFLFCIFIHIHIRWDKDKQETSLRTEIGLCDRLSRSQWGTSYGFTMGSDTDDQFNELVTLSCTLPFPRRNQVRETDLCYKQKYLNAVLQWHISIDTIMSIWPEDRSESCHTSMDCGQGKKQYYTIALCISAGDFQRHNRLLQEL